MSKSSGGISAEQGAQNDLGFQIVEKPPTENENHEPTPKVPRILEIFHNNLTKNVLKTPENNPEKAQEEEENFITRDKKKQLTPKPQL